LGVVGSEARLVELANATLGVERARDDARAKFAGVRTNARVEVRLGQVQLAQDAPEVLVGLGQAAAVKTGE